MLRVAFKDRFGEAAAQRWPTCQMSGEGRVRWSRAAQDRCRHQRRQIDVKSPSETFASVAAHGVQRERLPPICRMRVQLRRNAASRNRLSVMPRYNAAQLERLGRGRNDRTLTFGFASVRRRSLRRSSLPWIDRRFLKAIGCADLDGRQLISSKSIPTPLQNDGKNEMNKESL